ncbi:MAG: hypothetical protein M3350_11480 [Actinomycetota bacterium]|nr:hypothetical protein [Actinomycetota bacterium]
MGRRCSTRRRRGRRCSTYKKLGSFAVNGVRGPRSVKIPRRLRGKRLGAGRYRIDILARDSTGIPSECIRRAFKVNPRRGR